MAMTRWSDGSVAGNPNSERKADMPDEKRRCDLCTWWERLISDCYKDKGTCHGKCPHPWPMCGGREHTPLPMVAWPVTKADDFCSKFKVAGGKEN